MRKKQENDKSQETEIKQEEKKETKKAVKNNKNDNVEKTDEIENNINENVSKNNNKKNVKIDKVTVTSKKLKDKNIEEDEIEGNNNEEEIKDKKEEISKEKLDKIKDEIKNSKKKNKNNPKLQKVRKSVLRNILIAIIICIYFLFISLGTKTIPATEYVLDLKTFAIFAAIISIIVFEKAYKSDENYLAIHGIEMCVVGILTLVLLYFYSISSEYFNYIVCGVLGLVVIYYILKALIILIRNKINK